MAYQDHETQRRAAISPLYGAFANILNRLERALTTPHCCNPPADHAPVSLTPASSFGPEAGERIRATYICPECGLCWQKAPTAGSTSIPDLSTPAACEAA